MATLKITFKDNSTQIFRKDQISIFTVDEKSRIVYIIYANVVVRIPFEAIKMIEENRTEE
jgi:hypothetical protein